MNKLAYLKGYMEKAAEDEERFRDSYLAALGSTMLPFGNTALGAYRADPGSRISGGLKGLIGGTGGAIIGGSLGHMIGDATGNKEVATALGSLGGLGLGSYLMHRMTKPGKKAIPAIKEDLEKLKQKVAMEKEAIEDSTRNALIGAGLGGLAGGAGGYLLSGEKTRLRNALLAGAGGAALGGAAGYVGTKELDLAQRRKSHEELPQYKQRVINRWGDEPNRLNVYLGYKGEDRSWPAEKLRELLSKGTKYAKGYDPGPM